MAADYEKFPICTAWQQSFRDDKSTTPDAYKEFCWAVIRVAINCRIKEYQVALGLFDTVIKAEIKYRDPNERDANKMPDFAAEQRAAGRDAYQGEIDAVTNFNGYVDENRSDMLRRADRSTPQGLDRRNPHYFRLGLLLVIADSMSSSAQFRYNNVITRV